MYPQSPDAPHCFPAIFIKTSVYSSAARWLIIKISSFSASRISHRVGLMDGWKKVSERHTSCNFSNLFNKGKQAERLIRSNICRSNAYEVLALQLDFFVTLHSV